jgi:hypothetical protein
MFAGGSDGCSARGRGCDRRLALGGWMVDAESARHANSRSTI